jgi:7,8-dihydropterin-6-yl-methyl-4-(beta-D-ribofuranosyl)aminobenzene 5'-phosphate synthase
MGPILITGCCHAGIVNTAEFAKEILGEPVRTLIGGLHLQKADPEVVQKTGQWLKDNKIEVCYPCHCTDFAGKAILNTFVSIVEVGTGFVLIA